MRSVPKEFDLESINNSSVFNASRVYPRSLFSTRRLLKFKSVMNSSTKRAALFTQKKNLTLRTKLIIFQSIVFE